MLPLTRLPCLVAEACKKYNFQLEPHRLPEHLQSTAPSSAIEIKHLQHWRSAIFPIKMHAYIIIYLTDVP